jgi:hypothetical protein
MMLDCSHLTWLELAFGLLFISVEALIHEDSLVVRERQLRQLQERTKPL